MSEPTLKEIQKVYWNLWCENQKIKIWHWKLGKLAHSRHYEIDRLREKNDRLREELDMVRGKIESKDQPCLGYATTRQLLEELTARAEVDGSIEYKTVDS